MVEGTWDEQEHELIARWLLEEITTKQLLDGFIRIDKQRLGYIK